MASLPHRAGKGALDTGGASRRFSTSKGPTDQGIFLCDNVEKSQLLNSPLPELNSAVHLQFRQAHEGHKPHAGLDPARASTGVVWTTERAVERGFADDPHAWANLGQGAPEVDDGEFWELLQAQQRH